MTISKLSTNQRFLQYIPISLRLSGRPLYLPLLGSIKAGYPSLADESLSFVNLDEYLIKSPRSSFMLRIEGNNLVDLGINHGDLVIIEKDRQPKIGDIVLGLEQKRWIIKRYVSNTKISRDVASQTLVISFKEDLQIYGVVAGVVRKL